MCRPPTFVTRLFLALLPLPLLFVSSVTYPLLPKCRRVYLLWLALSSELPSGSSSSTSTARQKGTGDSVDIISSGSSSSSRNPFSPRLPAVDGQRDRYHHGGAKRNRVGTKAGRFMRGIAKLMGVLAVVWLTWLAMVETYVRTYCFQVIHAFQLRVGYWWHGIRHRSAEVFS